MNGRNGIPALIFHALFVGFILAPIVVVCLIAFTSAGYLSLPTHGVSLRWFVALWHNSDFVGAFQTSLLLGAISATIAVALSVPAALGIARHAFPGRAAMLTLFQSPLMIPPVVLGVAFLRYFTQIGLSGTFVGLLISHIIIVMPFALRTVLTSLAGIDRRLDDAAISLGASRFTIFRRVILPLILPGVVSGWVLAFITSFDEVTMTVFVASPRVTTLPVRLFLYIEDNIDPLVAAVSTTLIAFAVLALVVIDRLFGIDRLLVGDSRAVAQNKQIKSARIVT
jgi:putative spermidine/putrescine transport system permease protein